MAEQLTEKAWLVINEMAYLAENPMYFMDEYMYVEDKDDPEAKGITKLAMWPMQREAFQEILDNRLNIILKARQLGLTWLALGYIVWGMLTQPGFEAIGISKTDDDSMELCRRVDFIFRHLPGWMVQERTKENKNLQIPFPMTYDSSKHEVVLYRFDGEPARFKSKAAAEDSGRSLTGNVIMLDEWAFQQWAAGIWKAGYPTINRPTGGKVIGISTAKLGTFFHTTWIKAEVYGLHRIFLPWYARPDRDEAWYEQTKRAMGEGKAYLQEYPTTPEEAFSPGEGAAFPEFSLDVHVCKTFTPPKHWRRWMSVDNGYADPFAWHWYTVSEDGQVFIYREFTRKPEHPRLHYTEQAKKVKELSVYDPKAAVLEAEKIDFIVAGHDAWNKHHRDQSNKTLIDYYKEGGLQSYGFIKTSTDRKARKSTFHEYLKSYVMETSDGVPIVTSKLQIMDCCTELIESIPKLQEDEMDREMVADSSFDHWYDSAGYGILIHHAAKTIKPPSEKSVIQSLKEQQYRKARRKNGNYRR